MSPEQNVCQLILLFVMNEITEFKNIWADKVHFQEPKFSLNSLCIIWMSAKYHENHLLWCFYFELIDSVKSVTTILMRNHIIIEHLNLYIVKQCNIWNGADWVFPLFKPLILTLNQANSNTNGPMVKLGVRVWAAEAVKCWISSTCAR